MTPVQRAVVSCLAIVTAGQMPAFLTGALAVQVQADLDFHRRGSWAGDQRVLRRVGGDLRGRPPRGRTGRLADGPAAGRFLVSSAVAGRVGPGAAGLLLAAGSAAGLTVRITLGWLADRRPFHPLGAMATLLALGSAGCLLLAAGPMPAFVIGALLGVGAGWGWPGLYNLAVVRAHPASAALATGVTQTGVYVGAAIGPSAFGLLADWSGYRGAWLATTLLALVSALLAVRGRRALHARIRR